MNAWLPIAWTGLAMAATASAVAQSAPGAPVVQATVGSWQLSLSDQAGQCLLRAQNGLKPMKSTRSALPWPCAFHVDRQGRVRVLKHQGRAHLLLESAKLVRPGDCESHLQAVRVSQAVVKLSESHDKVASCPPFQWDEMIFTALFR